MTRDGETVTKDLDITTILWYNINTVENYSFNPTT